MERRNPNVLLIGENVRGSSLAVSLHKQGCESSFATCCLEAFLILWNREFDLVLSPASLRDGSMLPIMSLLEGSITTIFYSLAVEDGCWWLPALRRGQKCFGSPALRPSEFVILLDETIKQIHRDQSVATVRQPLLIVPAQSSVVLVPPHRAELMSANQGHTEKSVRVERKAAG